MGKVANAGTNKILNWNKLKAFADDILKGARQKISVFVKSESIV